VKVLAWPERGGRVLAPADTPAGALGVAGCARIGDSDLRPNARETTRGERDHVAVTSTPERGTL
jgi:hypothetical protein